LNAGPPGWFPAKENAAHEEDTDEVARLVAMIT